MSLVITQGRVGGGAMVEMAGLVVVVRVDPPLGSLKARRVIQISRRT
jgi:hypothetical protein